MRAEIELPPGADAVLWALAGDGMLRLSEVPNNGPRRQHLYAKFPDIRKTGVYVIRDALRQPGLFYVGKVVQDPTTDTINPNADGIIGRLSGQNMAGSPVLARWSSTSTLRFRSHPNSAWVPCAIVSGPRQRIVYESRMSHARRTPHAANRIESYVIKRGLPGDGVPPILNSPNWKSPISKQDSAEIEARELEAIGQRADPYTGPGRDIVRLLAEIQRLRRLGGDHNE